MAEVHGKQTVILVDTVTGETPSGTPVDITRFCDNSSFPRASDIHDVTTYGANTHKNKGGLKNPTFTMGGVFDDGASNTPRTLFEGRDGEVFEITRRVKGTGTGLPQNKGLMTLSNYTESNPVADFVRWTADFVSYGDISDTAQS